MHLFFVASMFGLFLYFSTIFLVRSLSLLARPEVAVPLVLLGVLFPTALDPPFLVIALTFALVVTFFSFFPLTSSCNPAALVSPALSAQH